MRLDPSSLTLCLFFAACLGGEASPLDAGAAGGGAAASAGGGSASGGGGGGGAGGGAAATGGGGGSLATGGGGGGAATGGGSAAGGGGAEAGCAGTSYALCEDFETTAAGAAPSGWSLKSGWGSHGSVTPTVQTAQAHRGAKALESRSDVPGQARLQRPLSGAVAQAHWGRLFYKVQTPVPLKQGGGYLHLTFAAVQGADEGRVVDTVEDPSGRHQFLFNVPDDTCCSGSSYDWTFDDGWHCAEWYVNASTQSYRFFVDSAEVTSIAFSHRSGSRLSTLSALTIGSMFYVQPTATFTSWIDDVAVASEQIGCSE